ncbi:transglycosylase domain-containing protein [Desulfobacterales bacterium HSG2]|nr:transglycosylase domain-containing protein [Desulfobacterales bacterium HSG2]
MENFTDTLTRSSRWNQKAFESYGLKKPRRPGRLGLRILAAILLITILAAVWNEMHTSFFQSRYLTEYAAKLSYSIEEEATQNVVFPEEGPFNKRRGYSRIPEFIRRLEAENYQVVEQACFSPELTEITKHGVTPPYLENPVVGLTIYDSEGTSVYDATAGRQVFDQFEDIPPLIVKSLLFIEDRELDNPPVPHCNPVINWNRLAMAGVLYCGSKIGLPIRVQGGSTLATQLEKYRYSPRGYTSSVADKLRQMTSATLRVYKDGRDTLGARRRIILDYINTAPLAAVPGHGEIYGLGAGFHAWFNLDLSDVGRHLSSLDTDPEKAQIFRQALTLLCAVRAPTYYMVYNYPALEKRVSDYITLLEKGGIINEYFASRARQTPVVFSPGKYVSVSVPFPVQKAVNSVRSKLTRTLKVTDYYDLARLDMKVETTINSALQKEVTNLFEKLRQPEFLKKNGLKAHRLLATGDAKKVIYSFLLFESSPYGNALRVQADSLAQPFDINEGMKLILGSTAKLRTLANYLDIVADLHQEFSGLDRKTLRKHSRKARDPITRWAARMLIRNKGLSMEDILEKALDRSYSANPDETFFTGGGIHRFKNFRSKHDSQIISVREATIHSINLVYIRLMKDLVRFYRARLPYNADKVLRDSKHPERGRLLEEIADNEAKLYLRRFYRYFRRSEPDAVLKKLLKRRVTSARHLAITFFAWHPGAGEEELSRWLKKQKPGVSKSKIRYLARAYSKPHLTISDYGFLLRQHPLKVWCAGEIIRNPDVSWKKLVEKSAEVRRRCSEWLFQPKMRKHQNTRLRTRIEKDAFEEMTVFWKRLGFPFRKLVPSYATAIGSSCDQPAALAKLIGVIVNDGVSRPAVSIRKIRMAEETPYHTIFDFSPPPDEQVIAVPVARTLRSILQAVVEQGTARRARGAFTTRDGEAVPVGGKTGTGDNRLKEVNRSGEVIASKALNRTATFAFYISDRYFGVITAFVAGSETKKYTFTSALPVSILKLLSPVINAHLTSQSEPEILYEEVI